MNLYKTVTTPEKETVPEKDDYRSTIKEAVADKQTFLRLIVSGVLHGEVSRGMFGIRVKSYHFSSAGS